MSVLIGMKMPKDCWHCPMINSVDECCLLTEEQHDMYEGVMDQVQAAFCPLVEIPPHGKLIDADGKTFQTPHRNPSNDYMKGWNACLRSVQQQPTVIPAEKEKP